MFCESLFVHHHSKICKGSVVKLKKRQYNNSLGNLDYASALLNVPLYINKLRNIRANKNKNPELHTGTRGLYLLVYDS